MKNRKVAIIIIVSVLLIMCLAISVISHRQDDDETPQAGESALLSTEYMQDTSSEADEEVLETSASVEAESAEPDKQQMASNGVLPTKPAKPLVGSAKPNKDPNTIKVESSEEKKKDVKFPYTDEITGLVIQSISKYEGIYLENGEDKSVKNVAVLVVKNPGNKDYEYVDITLTADKEKYEFKGSVIPAGSQIVLQEAEGKNFEKTSYSECNVDSAEADKLEMSEKLISCTEEDDGALKITNISSDDIACVRVFYKFYMADEKAYLGGITYNAKISDLKAGDSVSVTPSHYSKGYSKVVMIRTYDTDQD